MNKSFSKQTWVGIGVFLLILAAGTGSLSVGKGMWDFKIIYASANAYRAGADPYQSQILEGVKLNPYLYPPYTLPIFEPLTFFSFRIAVLVYLGFKLLALTILIYIWNLIFDFRRHIALFLAFILLAFNGTVLTDLRGGNVSLFEQLLIWLGFYFYSRDQVGLCAIAILSAAAVKFVPVLLIGILISDLRRTNLRICLQVILGAAALLIISVATTPHLWSEFLRNLGTIHGENGTNNPSTSALMGEVVFWLQLRTGIYIPSFVPSLLYVSFAVAAILISVATLRRIPKQPFAAAKIWQICMVCLLFILISPRVKNYSYILLIAPAFHLLRSRLSLLPLIPLSALFVSYTYREYNVLGSALSEFFQLEAEYFSLFLAWGTWALFCYSFWSSSSIDEEAIGAGPNEELRKLPS